MTTPAAPPITPAHLHDDQVLALLQSGAHAQLLIAHFGEEEYRELSQLAKLAAIRKNKRGPLVFILPGIMGSRLAMKRGRTLDLYWLHPHAIAAGQLMQLALPGSRALRPIGVMLPGYLKMKLMLEVCGFRPVLHAFDWRADLERNARSLMRAIERSDARHTMIVAHSMGAMIARAALRFDTAKRIKKLVQIGAPNEGSFAPVQALRAVYPTVRKIAALDRTHSAEELARKVFLTLPGLYQLLPSAESGEIDLFDAASWPSDLVPDAKLLAQARRVRARLPRPDARCHVVVGYGQDTITSLVNTDDMFTYEIRPAGDGTVPLTRACWDGARTWYARANHGALSTNSNVLGAVIDILRQDDTTKLTSNAPEPPPSTAVRHVSDRDLRRHALVKVEWDALTVDSRRRILEPIFTPEFVAPTD
jgi:pimeloyl-ACP methyl ester carboxylesterase